MRKITLVFSLLFLAACTTSPKVANSDNTSIDREPAQSNEELMQALGDLRSGKPGENQFLPQAYHRGMDSALRAHKDCQSTGRNCGIEPATNSKFIEIALQGLPMGDPSYDKYLMEAFRRGFLKAHSSLNSY